MPTVLESLNGAALLPVLAMITWTLIVWFWVLLTRIPAMQKAKIHPQQGQDTRHLRSLLPEKTVWISDNYNHLHEQPLLFYAVTVILSLTGGTTHLTWGLAWAYVVVRVVHSIWQSTVNSVPVRFGLFLLGSIILTILAVMALVQAH